MLTQLFKRPMQQAGRKLAPCSITCSDAGLIGIVYRRLALLTLPLSFQPTAVEFQSWSVALPHGQHVTLQASHHALCCSQRLQTHANSPERQCSACTPERCAWTTSQPLFCFFLIYLLTGAAVGHWRRSQPQAAAHLPVQLPGSSGHV